MADVTLATTNRRSPRADQLTADLRRIGRTIGTFLVVMLAFGLIWQFVKAAFNLDSMILPHIGEIGGALGTPVQAGRESLGAMLLGAALFTFRESALGFALGASVGFVLAAIFAHSKLLQRGLMPYVVASQTVPILAVAPIIIVWLKADWIAVAVVSAYLTFFPVTINTLRGLLSVPPTALELMQTYAANRWQILVKVRIPHALPYIFTALKISATASVVGAIIGELPSGIQSGLAYQILVYNQYYIQGPARLWATILVAALTGIFAFSLVSLAERLIVRWNRPERQD